jgi:hypothetical protein
VVSFAQLLEVLDNQKSQSSPLMNSGEEMSNFTVLRKGQELHKDKQVPFWDEFIGLCSDASGMSELLGVSTDKISSWPARIQEGLSKLERHKAMNPAEKEKTELIATGENGAFTTNSDPTNIGDLQ